MQDAAKSATEQADPFAKKATQQAGQVAQNVTAKVHQKKDEIDFPAKIDKASADAAQQTKIAPKKAGQLSADTAQQVSINFCVMFTAVKWKNCIGWILTFAMLLGVGKILILTSNNSSKETKDNLAKYKQ